MELGSENFVYSQLASESSRTAVDVSEAKHWTSAVCESDVTKYTPRTVIEFSLEREQKVGQESHLATTHPQDPNIRARSWLILDSAPAGRN